MLSLEVATVGEIQNRNPTRRVYDIYTLAAAIKGEQRKQPPREIRLKNTQPRQNIHPITAPFIHSRAELAQPSPSPASPIHTSFPSPLLPLLSTPNPSSSLSAISASMLSSGSGSDSDAMSCTIPTPTPTLAPTPTSSSPAPSW